MDLLASNRRKQRCLTALQYLKSYPANIDDELWPAYKFTIIKALVTNSMFVLEEDQVTQLVIRDVCQGIIKSPLPQEEKADLLFTVKRMARENILK